jgi:hypothetical protein
MSTERIVITLADCPNPHETRPAIVRLRAVCKLLLKGYGLRCVSIVPAGPGGCPADGPEAEPPSKS